MLMYELFQKFYLLCIRFLSKLLKKVLLKIKRVNQSEGGNTGTEIIRMTLKGYDKCTQHKAPWTDWSSVTCWGLSFLSLQQIKREMGATSNSSRREVEKFEVWRKRRTLEWPYCASKKDSNQLIQEKECLQEGCFQANNWNVWIYQMWLTLLKIILYLEVLMISGGGK